MAGGHGRIRLALLVLAAAAVTAAAAAVVTGAGADRPASGAAAREVLLSAQRGHRPVVVYRSVGRGQVAVAPLGRTPGPATAAALRCDRVFLAARAGICLAGGHGSAAGSRAELLGPDLRVRHVVPVEGIPSRARVSADGRYGAVTLFVTGHAYAAAAGFSTETILIDMASGRELAELEQFAVERGGRLVTAVDVNFWGVTFARDSDRFYATMATGGRTYLVRGSVRSRTARVVHENVECPSLSPDGARLAFKRRERSGGRRWRLTVLDLATMRETPLAETRSVDDQAAWLDDDHVLYGVDRAVWVARADGRGRPRRFLAAAGSPAVVRW
jgi:hypothetical protein